MQVDGLSRVSKVSPPPTHHIGFFESAAANDVLQVVVFTILFAIALAQVKGKPKETMLNFFEGLSEVMFKFTGLVMMFAPFGIGAAMAVTVGHSGLGVLKNLGLLVLTLYGALVVWHCMREFQFENFSAP